MKNFCNILIDFLMMIMISTKIKPKVTNEQNKLKSVKEKILKFRAENLNTIMISLCSQNDKPNV